jgi:hypothetical protein
MEIATVKSCLMEPRLSGISRAEEGRVVAAERLAGGEDRCIAFLQETPRTWKGSAGGGVEEKWRAPAVAWRQNHHTTRSLWCAKTPWATPEHQPPPCLVPPDSNARRQRAEAANTISNRWCAQNPWYDTDSCVIDPRPPHNAGVTGCNESALTMSRSNRIFHPWPSFQSGDILCILVQLA